MGKGKHQDEGTGILSAYASKAESRSGEKNLKSNEERDQPTENFNKCAELDWPSIFDLS